MLNEEREYQLLLGEKGYGGLLKYSKKEISGMRRSLVILARGMLEKLKSRPMNERYSITVQFLKTWLGDGQCDLSALDKSIREDFEQAAKNTYKAFANMWDKTFKEKIEGLEKSMFEEEDYNTKNRITFSGIVADALYTGALSNKVLVLRRSSNFDLRQACKGKKEKGMTEKQVCRTLGIVAWYLQHKNDGQRYAAVCQAEIGNYLGIESSSKGARSLNSVAEYIDYVQYVVGDSKRPLALNQVNGSNGSKLAVDADWLQEFDAQLVDADRAKAYAAKGYIVCTDEVLRCEKLLSMQTYGECELR